MLKMGLMKERHIVKMIKTIERIFHYQKLQKLRNTLKGKETIDIAIRLVGDRFYVSDEELAPEKILNVDGVWVIYLPLLPRLTVEEGSIVLAHLVKNISDKFDPDLKDKLYINEKIIGL